MEDFEDEDSVPLPWENVTADASDLFRYSPPIGEEGSSVGYNASAQPVSSLTSPPGGNVMAEGILHGHTKAGLQPSSFDSMNAFPDQKTFRPAASDKDSSLFHYTLHPTYASAAASSVPVSSCISVQVHDAGPKSTRFGTAEVKINTAGQANGDSSDACSRPSAAEGPSDAVQAGWKKAGSRPAAASIKLTSKAKSTILESIGLVQGESFTSLRRTCGTEYILFLLNQMGWAYKSDLMLTVDTELSRIAVGKCKSHSHCILCKIRSKIQMQPVVPE